MIILDTSLVGPIAIPDERGNLSPDAMARLVGSSLLVPTHWRVEVANMLRTAVRRDRLTIQQRTDVLAQLAALDIEIDRDTWTAAWGDTIVLSDRLGLTPYDAAYVELAIRRAAPLATRDQALARGAKSAGVTTLDFIA